MTHNTLSLFRGAAFRAIWDSARTSLWFLPALMGLITPALVLSALAADDWLGQGPDEL